MLATLIVSRPIEAKLCSGSSLAGLQPLVILTDNAINIVVIAAAKIRQPLQAALAAINAGQAFDIMSLTSAQALYVSLQPVRLLHSNVLTFYAKLSLFRADCINGRGICQNGVYPGECHRPLTANARRTDSFY